ncbi:MAG: 4-fold beta flower protein [Burkholderiales bacterium]
MEPIFNREGKTVGWLYRDVIFNHRGFHRAFINNSAVYNYQCRYLGRFDNGFLRDCNGRAVSFVHGASGGPATPSVEDPPISPGTSIPPLAPVPPAPPVPPVSYPGWSVLDFENFINAKFSVQPRHAK